MRADERKVICDLDHVDAAIRLFDQNADTTKIVRYPTKHRAKKGEVVRLVVRMLRGADRPLTSLDIVHQQIKERGLKADEATVVLMRKRVGACLTKLKSHGHVRVVPQAGLYQGWEWAR
ncbi:hypothetical protein [Brevundimonas fluminis]|uniref:hypothetical protein n=1 Tax=Brevundimonas fluminis TaxID=2487274 RepID=UPI001F49A693|nr:hypothetical protein [Brevundimonas fluminis]